MFLADAIRTIGVLLVITGFLAECVAMCGVAFRPVRRALPFKSPHTLQGFGCYAFIVGLLIYYFGQALR